MKKILLTLLFITCFCSVAHAGDITISAGAGDITSVGDCTSGAAFDGTSDGGTKLDFYDAQGATTLTVGNNTGAVALTMPIATGTLYTDSDRLVDIVTTSPLTVNTGASLNNKLMGTDADITWAIDDAAADDTTKGAATFEADDFDSASGKIDLADSVPKSVSTDGAAATPASNAFTIAGAGINVTSGSSATVTITATEAQSLSDVCTIGATYTGNITITGAVIADEFNLGDGEYIEWGADENLTFNTTLQDFVLSNDLNLSDAHPHLLFYDTDTTTGYMLHLDESAASAPWQGFTIWDVTNSAGAIADSYPEVFLDTSNNFSVDTKDGTFYVDATNNRVGIGDITPAALLSVGAGDPFQVDNSGNVTANEYNLADNKYIEWGTDENLTYDGTTNFDFELSDDLNLNDTDPHIGLVPTVGDEFEIYAYGSEIYCTNVTDGVILFKADNANDLILNRHVKTKSFVIDTPDADSDYPLWRTPRNITIKAIHVLCEGGTNIIGGLDEADANGDNAVAIDADITGLAGVNANDDGALTNPTVDIRDYLLWHTTSISGTPTSISVSFEYYEH